MPPAEGLWPLFCRKTPSVRSLNIPLTGLGSPTNQQTQITYLFLLLIEVVNDDTNEQVQGEKGAKDNEDNKIYVHVNVVLIFGLLFLLNGRGEEK